jgi:hypothetical protein
VPRADAALPGAVELLRPEAVPLLAGEQRARVARHSSANRSSPVRACIARAASIVPGAPSSSSFAAPSTTGTCSPASAIRPSAWSIPAAPT